MRVGRINEHPVARSADKPIWITEIGWTTDANCGLRRMDDSTVPGVGLTHRDA